MRETGLLPNVLFWILPQICTPAFPIFLQPCPRHVLANFAVSILFQTPLHSAISWNLSQYEYHLLPFTSSASHEFCSSVSLSFSLHSSTRSPYSYPALQAAFVFHWEVATPNSSLLFFLMFLILSLLTLCRCFPDCGSDLCLSSVSPKLLVFAPHIPWIFSSTSSLLLSFLTRTACLSLVKKHSPFSSSNL